MAAFQILSLAVVYIAQYSSVFLEKEEPTATLFSDPRLSMTTSELEGHGRGITYSCNIYKVIIITF